MVLNGRKVIDAEIDGLDMRDYPDFCDAYFTSAFFDDSGLELNETELDQLTQENGDYISEYCLENACSGY